ESGIGKELTDKAGSDTNLNSSKQAGVSNTQTKHSTSPHEDPEKSTKSEGAPETAKQQGSVDPSRPA
ncbi:hypothetical protein LTS18_007772, partial [Coniosporium uncinatum]